MPFVSGVAVHALDSGFHSGELADAQVPATISRDSEWNAIPFLTVSAQSALSAERAITPSNNMAPLGWETRKTSNQTVNNTTTLVTITGLAQTLPVGTSVFVHYLLRVATTAVADIKLAFSLPAGANFRGLVIGDNIGTIAWDGVSRTFNSGATGEVIEIIGVITLPTNGGTVDLQFAQGTATAVDTTVEAESCVYAFRTL